MKKEEEFEDVVGCSSWKTKKSWLNSGIYSMERLWPRIPMNSRLKVISKGRNCQSTLGSLRVFEEVCYGLHYLFCINFSAL